MVRGGLGLGLVSEWPWMDGTLCVIRPKMRRDNAPPRRDRRTGGHRYLYLFLANFDFRSWFLCTHCRSRVYFNLATI